MFGSRWRARRFERKRAGAEPPPDVVETSVGARGKSTRGGEQGGGPDKPPRDVEAAPDSIKAKLTLGAALLDAGRIDEALPVFASAYEIVPDRRRVMQKYAAVLARAGRHQEAAVILRQWAKNPADAAALRSSASLLLKAGQPEEALLSLERACAIGPSDPDSFYAHGKALAGLGRKDAALAVLAEARRIAPQNRAIRQEFGSLLAASGRNDEAVPVFEQLVAEAPDDVPALIRLAGLLFGSGRAAEAEPLFRRSVAAAPENLYARLGLVRAIRSLSRFEEALMEAEAAVQLAPADVRALTEQAVLLKALGRHEEAAGVHESIVAKGGRSVPALLRLAEALAGTGRFERALLICDEARLAEPGNPDVHRVRAKTLQSLARKAEAVESYEAAIAIDPEGVSSIAALAGLKESLGQTGSALKLLDRAIGLSPGSSQLLLARAAVRYQFGDPEGARRDASEAVSIDPGSARGLLYLSFMKDSERSPDSNSVDVCFLEPVAADQLAPAAEALGEGTRVVLEARDRASLPPGVTEVRGGWRERIAACAGRFVLIMPGSHDTLPDLAAHLNRSGDRIGLVGDDPAGAPCLWRRDVLVDALALFPEEDFAAFATALAPRLARRSLQAPDMPAPPLHSGPIGEGREAWLCSPEGIRLVGGVERYLRAMVPIYRDLGFRPVIVGIVGSMNGRDPGGEVDGVPFLNIPRSGGGLRALALQRNPAVVHATSGLGLEISNAFDGLDARLIYGMHFWSDMFLGAGSYGKIDENLQTRPEFAALCSRFDQIYVNSAYTAEVLGDRFDVGAQRIYPIGVEVEDGEPAASRGEYVLLLAGRPDKGLHLVLDVAALMPQHPFRVVAPLGLRPRTDELVAASGLPNVEVVDWTADTAGLYRGARAVLVPSFGMIETFSRVTVEAQSFGVPVVGSDRGNVAILLDQSGIALPEDPRLWSAELERLWSDDAYWRERSDRARESARRFPSSELHGRTGRMIRAATRRIGVAVGCGVGNIVQCTPAIRRIADHFGAPVDVLLREDYPGSRALLDGSPYVASVLSGDRHGPLARFDSLLIFDGFGPLLPRLNADRLQVAKHHFNYSSMGSLHEARFNLMCAERLLGVPFGEEDIAAYFVGDVRRDPVPRRIGLHAGCKPGVWLPKRWPHFAVLAERLVASGYEVVSLGSPDEYVPGTVNATGTDLAAAIRAIATCSYFVANDSGLMHVADALGVPLTAVFAPTSVDRYGPISPASRVVRIDRACSPCQAVHARMAACRCIGDIPVAAVAASVNSGLQDLEAAAVFAPVNEPLLLSRDDGLASAR